MMKTQKAEFGFFKTYRFNSFCISHHVSRSHLSPCLFIWTLCSFNLFPKVKNKMIFKRKTKKTNTSKLEYKRKEIIKSQHGTFSVSE